MKSLTDALLYTQLTSRMFLFRGQLLFLRHSIWFFVIRTCAWIVDDTVLVVRLRCVSITPFGNPVQKTFTSWLACSRSLPQIAATHEYYLMCYWCPIYHESYRRISHMLHANTAGLYWPPSCVPCMQDTHPLCHACATLTPCATRVEHSQPVPLV